MGTAPSATLSSAPVPVGVRLRRDGDRQTCRSARGPPPKRSAVGPESIPTGSIGSCPASPPAFGVRCAPSFPLGLRAAVGHLPRPASLLPKCDRLRSPIYRHPSGDFLSPPSPERQHRRDKSDSPATTHGARPGRKRRAGAPVGPDEVRSAVLEAAAKLFARHGVECVSLRDIAMEANVQVTLIPRYIGSRDA